MSNSNVLAQSATQLAASGPGSDEAFFASLPTVLAKIAGLSFENDNSTMKLEKVTLNKQALIDRVKAIYRAQNVAIIAKPEGGEKKLMLPPETFNRIKEAVDTFVDSQIKRLTSDKWELTSYNRKFAWSTKHNSYVESQSITSELIIDVKRQHLAATIDKGIAETKLSNLEKQNIPSDDIRIVNAKKRLDNINLRVDGINKKLRELSKATEQPTA